MDQLNTYIQQARQQGRTDEQIQQDLVGAGWSMEQVNGALLSSPAAVLQQSAPAKDKSRLVLILVSTIVLLLIIVIGVVSLLGHRTSYQAVIQNFITAVQNKDKAKADSFESPAARSYFQKNAGTASFYEACQHAGVFCTANFNATYLAKATKSYKPYTGSNGTKGKEALFTVKQLSNGPQAGGQGCSSNSTSTLTIAVVPKGNSWLIDYVDLGANASAQLCLAPGATSSAGNQ